MRIKQNENCYIDYPDKEPSYEELLQENKKLKQWDCNKNTRNSRQRIANAKQLKQLKNYKSRCEKAIQFINNNYLEEYPNEDILLNILQESNQNQLDDVIEWLEKNMNKNGYFYYKESNYSKDIIDCYWKKDDKHFAYFYRKEIEKMLYGGRTDKESVYE